MIHLQAKDNSRKNNEQSDGNGNRSQVLYLVHFVSNCAGRIDWRTYCSHRKAKTLMSWPHLRSRLRVRFNPHFPTDLETLHQSTDCSAKRRRRDHRAQGQL